MGYLTQLIGILLILAGVMSIITRIPNIAVSQFADGIDPTIRLFITNPSLFLLAENKENTLFFDVILIFIIIFVGVILLMKGGRKTKTNPFKK